MEAQGGGGKRPAVYASGCQLKLISYERGNNNTFNYLNWLKGFITDIRGGVGGLACSTWQGMGPQLHVEDKKQVMNRSPASSGRTYYLGKRLSEAEPRERQNVWR